MTPPRRFTELAAALAALLFLLAWAALHTAWYDDGEIVDIPVYASYGNAIQDGAVPYRDIRPEYPPGALPAFVVPALLTDDEDGFRRIFESMMALFGVATVLLAAVTLRGLRASRRRTAAALALVAAFPLLLGSVVLTRFDLYPAALLLAALAALVHGRDRLGFGLLGAAVAVKLYPAVLVPLAAAYVWRRRGRREALVCLGIAAGVVALVFLPFLLVSPDGVANSVGRQLSRPLQIESFGSAVLLAAHDLFGAGVEVTSSHGSQNLVGLPADVAAAVLSLAQVAVLAWLWLRFAQSRETPSPASLAVYAATAITAFVALGKVLSPQFLIWLVPVVVLARRASANAMLAAALVLTQLWFPFRYWDLVRELDPRVSWLVLARDLVLLALLATLVRAVREPARGSSRSA